MASWTSPSRSSSWHSKMRWRGEESMSPVISSPTPRSPAACARSQPAPMANATSPTTHARLRPLDRSRGGVGEGGGCGPRSGGSGRRSEPCSRRRALRNRHRRDRPLRARLRGLRARRAGNRVRSRVPRADRDSTSGWNSRRPDSHERQLGYGPRPRADDRRLWHRDFRLRERRNARPTPALPPTRTSTGRIQISELMPLDGGVNSTLLL